MQQIGLGTMSIRVGLLLGSCAAAAFAQCTHPKPTINNPNIPADVQIASSCTGNPIAYFDDYSWQAFLALVWPAKLNGQTPARGVPDTSQTNFPTNSPLVFETYKADWETFQPGGAPPSAFSSYTAVTPCGGTNPDGQYVFDLASFTKFGNLGQTTFTTQLAGPLVVQNNTYTRYLASYNETEFNAILGQQWFLLKNVPPNAPGTITFPLNSVDVKSAWALVTPAWSTQKLARFYTTKANVYDPVSNQCSAQTMALVGLHIVQKTNSRPEWIWTSFEQMDNVPPSDAAGTYNNGKGTLMPTSNPISFPPPPEPPTVFNVNRINPINPSTIATNNAYQNALKAAFPNVPWQYYELVMTQWPIQPTPVTNQSAKPANTFPGTSNCPIQVPPAATCSAFANTTLETFDQVKVGTGCMNCHNAVFNDDFVWSLQMNAYSEPSLIPRTLLTRSAPTGAFHDLEQLLESTVVANKQENAFLAKKKAATKK